MTIRNRIRSYDVKTIINFRILPVIGTPILLPTIYESSTIKLPTWDLASLSDPSYAVEKWFVSPGKRRWLYVSESLCSAYKTSNLSARWKKNEEVAPSRRYASENRGCHIDGPWPVHRLRHREGDPLFVAITHHASLDLGLSRSLKATNKARAVQKEIWRGRSTFEHSESAMSDLQYRFVRATLFES